MDTKDITSEEMDHPQDFDKAVALDAAMKVFLEKSYEQATLVDLTDAMGISRSSMYATFGNKQELFKLVLQRHREGSMAFVVEAIAQSNIQAVIKTLLSKTVEFLAASSNSHGSLSLQGAMTTAPDSEAIRKALLDWRKQDETSLQKRFLQAQQEKDFPDAMDPTDFARYIVTLIYGLEVQAASGATKSEMKRVVDVNLRLMHGTIFEVSR